MATKIQSATYSELHGILIDVEVHITKGMPIFIIVGLPDASVKEAKERVRSAIINSGYMFPLGRITINLAPADVKKIGSLLDLPIALAILIESKQIEKGNINEFIIMGELSLEGSIKGIKGTLPILLEGLSKKYKKFIFPYENISETSYCEEALLYPFNSLSETVSFIEFNDVLPYMVERKDLIEKNEYYNFSEIIGQENAKRAFEISAAGKHNLMIFGSTGVGKTMLARALPSILPTLNREEELEIAKIYSVMGLIKNNKKIEIPFRTPHHTITRNALIGGGKLVRPGEVTLAHKGILFLDEILEFKKEVLEVLREPLEDGKVHINRVQGNYEMPSDFILIGAYNMCPCGKKSLNDYGSNCTCTDTEIRRYRNRLSKALVDRVDLFSYVPRIEFNEINSGNSEYTSEKMKYRVLMAREKQEKRLKGTKYKYNSQIKGKDIFELCRVSKSIQEILKNYFNSSNPSLRAYGKVIKIARTISDIDNDINTDIKEENILEALSFRRDCTGEYI